MCYMPTSLWCKRDIHVSGAIWLTSCVSHLDVPAMCFSVDLDDLCGSCLYALRAYPLTVLPLLLAPTAGRSEWT